MNTHKGIAPVVWVIIAAVLLGGGYAAYKYKTTNRVVVRLTPSTGAVVRSGDTIQIKIETMGGKAVRGVLLTAPLLFKPLEGPGPFSVPYRIATDFVGKLEISAEAFVSETETYSGSSIIIVQPIAPVDSIMVSSSEFSLTGVGQLYQLSVLALLTNGATIDVTSSRAGTSYSLLSHSTSVVSVSPDGLVKALGIGEDVVLISNSGKSTSVIVTVMSFK